MKRLAAAFGDAYTTLKQEFSILNQRLDEVDTRVLVKYGQAKRIKQPKPFSNIVEQALSSSIKQENLINETLICN